MNTPALETEALTIYRIARLDPADVPRIGVLVRRVLGTQIRSAPMREQRDGALVRVRNEWRIYVRDGLPATRAKWVAAHELAHWVLDRRGGGSEDDCDALGAALIAPSPCYASIRSRISRVRLIACALGTTQSLAALREGEVMKVPVALVEPHRVVVRGGFELLHDARRVEQSAIIRLRIDDEPNRSVLVVRANPQPPAPTCPPPKMLRR